MNNGKHEYRADVIGKSRSGQTVSCTLTVHADTESGARSNARAMIARNHPNFAKIVEVGLRKIK